MSKKLFSLAAAAAICVEAGAAVGAAGPMLTRAAVASRLAGADFDAAWGAVEQGAESVSAKATGVYKSQFKRLMAADLQVITLIYSECERKGAYPSLGNVITAYEVPSISKAGRKAGTPTPPKAGADDAGGDPSPTGAVTVDPVGDLLSQINGLKVRLIGMKAPIDIVGALDDAIAFVRITK